MNWIKNCSMNSSPYDEIIFGTTQEVAESKLRQMIYEIDMSQYEYIESMTRDRVVTNLRKIKATKAMEYCRAYRCFKAYVDYDVSIRMLHHIIMPIMNVYPMIPVEQRIEYF